MPSTPQAKAVLDRKDIPGDKNAYVYRDGKRGGRWCLYFYDRETTNRHRFVLKDGNGAHPPATAEAQDEAWMLGIAKFVELKGKSDKGGDPVLVLGGDGEEVSSQEEDASPTFPTTAYQKQDSGLLSHNSGG